MPNMTILYNILGTIICVLSIIMGMLPTQDNSEKKTFNLSKRSLSVGIFLTGISMFIAQFEKQLDQQQFEKIDILMLLFFFLIGQGIIFSILILYRSDYANKQHLKRALLPVLPWFVLYALICCFTGDIRVYSFKDFFQLMPQEPLLILRCIILVSIISSGIYTLRFCHKAKSEYNKLIISYFSETDFSRSIWLSNLLGYAEALSLWVILTYFYTTPILEAIVGILITIFFMLYIKEFHYYNKRYALLQPAILIAKQNNKFISESQNSNPTLLNTDPKILRREYIVTEETTNVEPESILANTANTPNERQIEIPPEITNEDDKYHELLSEWVKREDKPYMRSGLTIGDVANDLDIPKYRLSEYINRKQANFNTWINELRIKEASWQLLESPPISISVVAKNCGFCDLPAFSRAFKKIKGVSPTEYRNHNPTASGSS